MSSATSLQPRSLKCSPILASINTRLFPVLPSRTNLPTRVPHRRQPRTPVAPPPSPATPEQQRHHHHHHHGRCHSAPSYSTAAMSPMGALLSGLKLSLTECRSELAQLIRSPPRSPMRSPLKQAACVRRSISSFLLSAPNAHKGNLIRHSPKADKLHTQTTPRRRNLLLDDDIHYGTTSDDGSSLYSDSDMNSPSSPSSSSSSESSCSSQSSSPTPLIDCEPSYDALSCVDDYCTSCVWNSGCRVFRCS